MSAVDISAALVNDHPNDLEARRDLLISTERIGDVLQATGDTANALDHQRNQRLNALLFNRRNRVIGTLYSAHNYPISRFR